MYQGNGCGPTIPNPTHATFLTTLDLTKQATQNQQTPEIESSTKLFARTYHHSIHTKATHLGLEGTDGLGLGGRRLLCLNRFDSSAVQTPGGGGRDGGRDRQGEANHGQNELHGRRIDLLAGLNQAANG